MVDKECIECKRYFTKSCDGSEDRGRKEITVENSCSGFLHIEIEEIIDRIYDIIIELDARESTNNCVTADFIDKSWTELCEEAIELLQQVK